MVGGARWKKTIPGSTFAVRFSSLTTIRQNMLFSLFLVRFCVVYTGWRFVRRTWCMFPCAVYVYWKYKVCTRQYTALATTVYPRAPHSKEYQVRTLCCHEHPGLQEHLAVIQGKLSEENSQCISYPPLPQVLYVLCIFAKVAPPYDAELYQFLRGGTVVLS